MDGHSLLVVPLPAAVSAVPALGWSGVPFVPLLAPLAGDGRLDPGVVQELQEFFADVVAFQVRLSQLVLPAPDSPRAPEPSAPDVHAAYLTPEPMAPFHHLQHGLGRLLPGIVPPAGAVRQLPQVTVPMGAGITSERMRSALEPRLPVAALADHAELWWREGVEVATLASFPFGITAA